MRLFSLLHRKINRPTVSKPYSQFTISTSAQFHNTEFNSIQSISENPTFCLLNLCRSISSLQNTLLIVDGGTDDPLLKTKLVGMYGLFGYVNKARLLFDEIPHPDFGSCKACTKLRDLSEGRKLHCCILQICSPDSFVLTVLVDMHAKCGELNTARKMFERIPDRNVVCWTSMIVGYVQKKCAKEGLLLFNHMRDCLVEANAYTSGSIISACAKLGALHQGKWVHGNVIKNGIVMNPYLFTLILDMYVKCGAIKDARSILDEFHIIDLVSWTAMIVGYAQNGFAEEALLLFIDKKWQDVCPNSVTLASVLSACARSENLCMGSLVHDLGLKLGQDDANVMNALVDMFRQSIIDKDVVSLNSIISGYSQNGYSHKVLRLFNRMRSNRVPPDPVTIVALLSACASLGDFRIGSSFHAYSIKEGFSVSTSVYIGTSLLNLYATCGDAEYARAVFDDMAWSAMIGGYGRQGDSNECIELFDKMVKENMGPTDIIFTTILSACSHSGMINEGWRYFGRMCEYYDYTSSMRHYVCMVDLLARSGRLEESLEFIENMPIEPDCAVFGSFLHGCGVHSRFDLGDLAVRKMLELSPDDPGHYMLMSNLNACRGGWGQVGHFRDLMNSGV
ncbi:hypothetical protein MIMGU_mgv1a026731mg [Erythranthe guttata]|uniref:Pentacotripeptide-repeat region of PRORP domain-containing protein n=1 Tax=Erythranthe guttata TaxID=4155 RepID=A0A022QMJ3_ERYGU|nr:hypothetical protein MIMGU_mgv1a026731mg [Erythranthe guttata]